jgi:hypothetical protein
MEEYTFAKLPKPAISRNRVDLREQVLPSWWASHIVHQLQDGRLIPVRHLIKLVYNTC